MNEEITKKCEPLACSREEARRVLGGISESTMWRLEKRGLIKAIPHLRHKLYSIEELRRFVSGKISV